MESVTVTSATSLSYALVPCNRSVQDCDEETYPFFTAAETINMYYMWFILALGFPANLATIVVISRMRSLGSFVIYVALLAVMDNLAIIVKILFYQLLLNKVNIGTLGCRLLEYFGNTLIIYCNWLLVLMSVERLIAVRYPFRIHFQSCLNRQKAVIAVVVLAVIIGGINVPILWLSVYQDLGMNPECAQHRPSLLHAVRWTTMMTYAFVPFVIIVFCNLLIAREIRMSFRLRSSYRNPSGDFSDSMVVSTQSSTRTSNCEISTQRQIMLMLFATTFMFLVLHFPICVFFVINHWPLDPDDNDAYSLRFFCQQLAYVLCDSNHALNFYFYLLSGRKFRIGFKKVCHK